VILERGTYRMWFSAVTNGNYTIGYATLTGAELPRYTGTLGHTPGVGYIVAISLMSTFAFALLLAVIVMGVALADTSHGKDS
jgi:hypothetical protein